MTASVPLLRRRVESRERTPARCRVAHPRDVRRVGRRGRRGAAAAGRRQTSRDQRPQSFAWPPVFVPRAPTLAHFGALAATVELRSGFALSLLVAIVTVVATLAIAAPAAWLAARATNARSGPRRARSARARVPGDRRRGAARRRAGAPRALQPARRAWAVGGARAAGAAGRVSGPARGLPRGAASSRRRPVSTEHRCARPCCA